MSPAYCKFQMWRNIADCTFKGKAGSAVGPCWALTKAQSSLFLCVCVFDREKGGHALSMCDNSVPDTLITLHVTCWQHTHTRTENKGTSEGRCRRVGHTSTTRRVVKERSRLTGKDGERSWPPFMCERNFFVTLALHVLFSLPFIPFTHVVPHSSVCFTIFLFPFYSSYICLSFLSVFLSLSLLFGVHCWMMNFRFHYNLGINYFSALCLSLCSVLLYNCCLLWLCVLSLDAVRFYLCVCGISPKR